MFGHPKHIYMDKQTSTHQVRLRRARDGQREPVLQILVLGQSPFVLLRVEWSGKRNCVIGRTKTSHDWRSGPQRRFCSIGIPFLRTVLIGVLYRVGLPPAAHERVRGMILVHPTIGVTMGKKARVGDVGT